MNKQDKIEHINNSETSLVIFPFKISVTSEKNTKIDIIKFFLVIFFENKNVSAPNKNCQNLNNGE